MGITRHIQTPALATLAVLISAATSALAGPPFQTDDPEPIDFRNYEFYTFASSDGTPLETDTVGPGDRVQLGSAAERAPAHHRSGRRNFSSNNRVCSAGRAAASAWAISNWASNTGSSRKGKHRPMIGTFTDVRDSHRQRRPRAGRGQDLVQGPALGAEELRPVDHLRRRRSNGRSTRPAIATIHLRAGWCSAILVRN